MTPEQALVARRREASPPPEPERPEPRQRLPRLRGLASDERLAQRASQGDADAFAAIFRRYEKDLYRFCVGILGEPQDAQDAIQNTMMKVMRALPGERRDIQLRPWLYRIAHNEAVELRRRQRCVEQLEPTIAEVAVSVDERAERSERLQVLFRDMTDLPERQRAALVMRELNGLEFGEIAAALRTSPSAVRQALYEARRGLQQMELGRHMACDSVTRVLSDEDGRLRGRRDVRAHLRACPDCRRFRREIDERSETLAAISPLPVLVAGALLKGALGGSGAGAAGAGAGGAGAAAGLAGGAAASSGLVKAVAGVLAIAAIGTAAADRSGLVDLHSAGPGTTVEREAGSPNPLVPGARIGASDRSDPRAPRVVRASSARASSPSGQAEANDRFAARSGRGEPTTKVGRSASDPLETSPVRSEPPSAAAEPLHGSAAAGSQQAAAKTEGSSAAGEPASAGHPKHPDQPGRGPKEEGGAKNEKGAGSADQTEKAEARTEKKEAKAEEKSEKAQSKAEAKPEKAPKDESRGSGNAPPPTVPTRPEHPPHPEQSQKEAPAPPAEPAAVEPEEAAAPVESRPGNGSGNGKGLTKKEAEPAE